MRLSVTWSGALLCAALACGVARAQPVVTILHPNPMPDGHFGAAVAELGGDLLVTAASTLSTPGGMLYVGVVYLVDASTGSLLQTFTNPDPSTYKYFGVSLAALGGNALIGAYGTSGGVYVNGAAFIFDSSTGALVRTFPSPAADPYARFGASVAALGSNVLVGAPGNDFFGVPGAVYLLDGTTGTLLRTFQAPTPAVDDSFGSDVAAVGGNVLVGAPGTGSNPGAAYLFDGATGALLQTFVDPSPPAGDPAFGFQVAAAGNDVLVGDPLDDAVATDAGAVHLFDADTGALVRTITSPIPGTGLGAFAVSGGHVLIAARSLGGLLFDLATGDLTRTLFDPTPVGQVPTGSGPVAFADGHPVLTNADDELPTVRVGAVYVFCGGASGCGPCETCGPAGTCVVAPHPTCYAPTDGAIRLRVVNRTTSDDGDVVSWSGAAVFDDPLAFPSHEIFGLPTDAVLDHDYTLCVYDESGGPPSLLFRATAPAGDGWASGRTGFRYRTSDGVPDGIRKLVASRSARTRLKVQGAGEKLSGRPGGLPPLPLPLPLRVQLQVREGGICWEAEYSAATANTPELFKAISD